MANVLAIIKKIPNFSELTHTSSVTAPITETRKDGKLNNIKYAVFKELSIWDMEHGPSTSK